MSAAARRLRSFVLPALLGSALLLGGCGPKQFVAEMNVPPPLIEKIPVAVGVYLPPSFTGYLHQEERQGSEYQVAIGKAQSDGFMRLLTAMFERVVPMSGTDAAAFADPAVRGALEPLLEDFSFVTPRDAGSPFYAVSLRYRINLYSRAGQLAESWTFTGYGSVQTKGLPTEGFEPLRAATALAMRDAGAKLAAEFHEQAIARGLLPGDGTPAEVRAPSPPPPLPRSPGG